MTDVLIITNYFPPETGAASNRIYHLADGMQKRNFNVAVLTPLPNYPTGKIFSDYKGRSGKTTDEKGVKVTRLWLYASNSKNKLLRLFAMLSYSLSLIRYFIFNKIPKTVIIQSPPLIVAFTCVLFLRSKKRRLILNVSDLWPLAGLELGAFKKGFGYRMLEKIERFNYRRADLVLGQSNEILSHIAAIFPEKKSFLYRNFPDFKAEAIKKERVSDKKITLVYAGLLGVAQGIYMLIQCLDYSHIELHLYGAGAEADAIETYIDKHPNLPIVYHGEVSRNELHKVIQQYDVALIPLLNRIYGSVPSKIFEYAKLGLPILYFGGGEGESIIKDLKLGWVAPAGNYDVLNMVISKIDHKTLNEMPGAHVQSVADAHFDFNSQLDRLCKLLDAH